MTRFASLRTLRGLEQAGASIWSWDPVTLTLRIDDLAVHLTGWPSGDDVIRNLDSNHAAQLLRSLDDCFRDGSPVRLQLRCRRADGRDVWLDLRGSRLCCRDDGHKTVSGLLWDIADTEVT